MTSRDWLRMDGGSRHFVNESVRGETGPPPAVRELLEALSGPRTCGELAETLGISQAAVRRRIFSARKLGYPIHLSGKQYHIHTQKRICAEPGCGKELSKYNPDSKCFNHQ